MFDNAHYTKSFLLIFTLTKTYKWYNNNVYVAVNFFISFNFFSITSNLIKSAKKVPLKINNVSIKILLIDRCQPLAPPTNDTQTFTGPVSTIEFRSPESNYNEQNPS